MLGITTFVIFSTLVYNTDAYNVTYNNNNNDVEARSLQPFDYFYRDMGDILKMEYNMKLIEDLDDFNRGLYVFTNTILLYDLYVDNGISENLKSFTYAIKLKHEIYFLIRNVHELKYMNAMGKSISIDNSKAVILWLRIFRSILTIINIKIDRYYSPYNNNYHTNMLSTAISTTLFPLRASLCGINLIHLILRKFNWTKAYIATSSCLRVSRQWYKYINNYPPHKYQVYY